VAKEEYDFENCDTRKNHYGPYVEADVVAALNATRANYAKMSVLLGRRRTSIRDFVLSHLDVKTIHDEIREKVLDDVETMHDDLALAGDGPSMRFILSTLGKERGYSTRIEQTGKNGGPQEHTLDASKLSTEQLRAVREALHASRNGEPNNDDALPDDLRLDAAPQP